MSSSCPFCHLNIPLAQLERHANKHLEEDELARDMDLAQKIVTASFGDSSKISTKCNISRNCKPRLDKYSISFIVSSQTRGSFHKVEGGLMMLLSRCLDMESDNVKSVICGYVDHFQSTEIEDFGWGCGWRNIQMLSSHLLMERQEAKEVIFGGSGFVPDIPSLQRWLELAWERGFDGLGAKSFNYKIAGSTKWIGATECATLFLKSSESSADLGKKAKRKEKDVHGPMDKFLLHTVMHDKSRHASHTNGPQVLVDWVWNYFNSGVSGQCSHQVSISEKMPLYFQHNGHSRTIVGIQVKKGTQGMPDVYSLLVLDPSQARLYYCLLLFNARIRCIKNLCFVDIGIAHGEEIERMKLLDSVLIKI
ncbi:unnamed protein product [Spirodela intermedia]|uniref:UFSP1/2/DUB catalytic domain-containing protein n=1 Tax=Spirodela intermedia TaxID=51605 RepID=A0A7I8IF93_SPIIN|nr:unnamed protein product [Spirodela intermedia]CAA6656457.1 unnamed protein product [Spirodela intermedia]